MIDVLSIRVHVDKVLRRLCIKLDVAAVCGFLTLASGDLHDLCEELFLSPVGVYAPDDIPLQRTDDANGVSYLIYRLVIQRAFYDFEFVACPQAF